MKRSNALVRSIRSKLEASQYLRDVLLQASGNTAAQVIGIAVMPILTRLYAPSDFAAFNLFSQTVAGLTILMTLRYEYLVMLPVTHLEAKSILRRAFILGAVHTIWMTPLLVAMPSSWTWLHSKGVISDWLWLAPISASAFSLTVGIQQAVQRQGNFRSSAAAEFIGRCSYVASTLLGALVLPNLAGLMISTLSNSISKLAWLHRGLGDMRMPLWRIGDVPIARSIHRLAFSTSVANLIALVSGIVPVIFIADQYGATALGQYGLAVTTLYLPSTLLGQAIGQVYYQRACALEGENKEFSGILVKTAFNLALIAVPMYTLIWLLSPMLYPLVFGAEWQRSGDMARWLSIGACIGLITTPLDKTSLVRNVWWYSIFWHSLRSLTALMIAFIADKNNVSLIEYLKLLAIQSSVIYIIDLIFNYKFSKQVHLSKER